MVVLKYVAQVVIVAILLFASRNAWNDQPVWNDPYFWAYIGVLGVGLTTLGVVIDPGLRKERIKAGPGGHDHALSQLVRPFLVAHYIIAGLDARYDWSNHAEFPLALHIIGLVGVGCGIGLVCWAMLVNRFFSPIIRLQSDRGHHLVDRGPYSRIRHPGYTGMCLIAVMSGLALGSWWSMIPMVGYVALIVRRTLREDSFLRRELPGYAEYASKVRARLVPGVW